MKVVLAEQAVADLISIGRYIQQDNPTRAATFIAELEDKCDRLGLTPKAFPLVPGRESLGIRRRVHGNYLIFYRIRTDVVEVLHILNGAMDYDPLLFPEE